MSDEKYTYDAFISYRQLEPDQSVAKHLHKQLESFKLPKNLARALKKNDPNAPVGITKVFRDKEELSLSSSLENRIVDALRHSKWLIVVCSPALSKSIWCMKEIETFIQFHGRDRILTVLADGHSRDCIPEILRISGDPFSGDYRDYKKNKHKNRDEFLRLVAPMFDLSFDELKQRHREQQLKKRATVAGLVALVSIMLAVTGTIIAIHMTQLNNKIKRQSRDISYQAKKLEDKNESLLTDQALFLASTAMDYYEAQDRENAINCAYLALTEYEGSKMPYTDEAMYALTTALNPYSVYESDNRADDIVITPGLIKDIQISPDGKTAMFYDSSNTLTFVDIASKEIIGSTPCLSSKEYENDIFACNYNLIDASTLLYTYENKVYSYDIVNGTPGESPVYEEPVTNSNESSDFYINSIEYDASNGYIIFNSLSGFTVMSSDCKDIIYSGTTTGLTSELISPDSHPELIYTFPDNTGNLFIYTYDSHDGWLLSCWDYNEEHKATSVLISDNIDDNIAILDALIHKDYLVLLTCAIEYTRVNTFIFRTDVCCYDKNTGELLWKNSYDNDLVDVFNFSPERYLYKHSTNDGNTLLVIGNSSVNELSFIDGAQFQKVSGNSFISSYYRDSQNTLYLFSSDGIRHRYRNHKLNYYIDAFTYNSKRELSILKNIGKTSSDGYILVPDDTNTAIFYSSQKNDAIQKTDEVFDIKTNDYYYIADEDSADYIHGITHDELNILTEAMGFNNPDTIAGVAFNYDDSVMCVSYFDNTCVLFDVDLNILATFKQTNYEPPITRYCGEDQYGNTYWASEYYGYCFSPDNNLIATIDCLLAVDKDSNQLIIGEGSEDSDTYVSPIYSLEELLQMAEEYLE